MQTSRTSSLYTTARRAALFDELQKIAEAQGQVEPQPQAPQKNWKKEVAKTILLGGAGVGLGFGAGTALTHSMPSFFMNKGQPQTANLRGKAVQVILPILGASALMLGDRFRHRMDETYRKAPGWGTNK